MSLIQAKCTNCGANLKINPDTESGICPYCNTAYITQKAIVNYNNTIINNNNIHADNVNIIGANKDNLLRLADECWRGRDYEGAYANYTKVLEIDPDNEDAALYRALCVGWKEANTNYLLITNTYSRVFGKIDYKNAGEKEAARLNYFLVELEKLNCASINSELKSYDPEVIDEDDLENLLSTIETIIDTQSDIICFAEKIKDYKSEYLDNYIEFMKDQIEFYDMLCDDWYYFVYYDNGSRKRVKVKCSNKIDFMSEQKRMVEIIKQYEPDFKYRLKDGCYIATAVYGSYDCPQVWTLRRYRDDVLGKNIFGRLFIRIYYAISPVLVKLFGKLGCFRNFWRKRLDKMVNKLKNRGFEDTPYKDKNWRKR